MRETSWIPTTSNHAKQLHPLGAIVAVLVACKPNMIWRNSLYHQESRTQRHRLLEQKCFHNRIRQRVAPQFKAQTSALGLGQSYLSLLSQTISDHTINLNNLKSQPCIDILGHYCSNFYWLQCHIAVKSQYNKRRITENQSHINLPGLYVCLSFISDFMTDFL